MTLSDNLRGILYMNIAMLAFTVNDTLMKAVFQTMPLFEAITLRGVLTTVALIGISFWTTGALRLLPPGRDRLWLVLRSIGEVGGTVLFLVALQHMQLANLSAVMQSMPLAVTLTAALVFGDKIGWRRMIAILAGFVGVMIVIRPGSDVFDIWSVMGLGSVACVVLRDLVTRNMSKALPSVSVAIWASGTVLILGLVGAVFQGWNSVTLQETCLIVGASLALIVGYMFVVMVMRVGDIGVIAPFRYMSLIWAIVFGWLIFGTLPDGKTVLGSAIVVASGIYALLRERQLRRMSAGAG